MISNNTVQNIFKTLNQMKKTNNSNNNDNNNDGNKARRGEWHRSELIFGEELDTYIPFETNIQRTIMERDPSAGVKMLVTHVPTIIYGEPRFVDHVVGVYKELKNERKAAGFIGMRGKNMKGLITAILYLVILYEEKARLSLHQLVKAVNHVRSESKVPVTEKMLQQYIAFIQKNLKAFRNRTNNINNNNNNNKLKRAVLENIRRLSVLLEYSIKTRVMIQKSLDKLPGTFLESHVPNTIASGLVFMYATQVEMPAEYPTQKALLERINVTRYAMKKLTPKLEKYFQ
jgi:hypothetical protein